MRRDIDYRTYDPADFKRDHPDDPVLAEARGKVDELAASLKDKALDGTVHEQRRQIEQHFDELQSVQWDGQQQLGLYEQQKELHDYSNEKTDAIYNQAHERVIQGRNKDQQVAAWEGVSKQVADTRANAASGPDFQRRLEQLTHFQAARSEAASSEIHNRQQELLHERGLENAEPEKSAENGIAREEEAENKNLESGTAGNSLIVDAKGRSFEEAMQEHVQNATKRIEQVIEDHQAAKVNDHSID